MADIMEQPDLGTDVLSTTNAITNGLATPLRGFRFTATFPGLGTTSFRDIQSGWSINVQESQYREGGFGSLTSRKLPGLIDYSDFMIKKGMYKSPLLYDWFTSYTYGANFTPVNATIILYDNAGNPTVSWTVLQAWPKSYESDGLDSTNSEVLYETITIAHEGIRRDNATAQGA